MSLRQSFTDLSRQRPPDAERRSLCWRQGREQPCLRVERKSDAFIFPYQQFLGAHHTRQGEVDSLIISFSTHEITISGRQLDEVALALQELAIVWIKTIPERYRELPKNEGPWITQIDVKPSSS